MRDSEDNDHNINASSQVPSHLPPSALARHLDSTGMVSPFCEARSMPLFRIDPRLPAPILQPASDTVVL